MEHTIWSLDHTPQPWPPSRSLYEHLVQNPAEPLPEESAAEKLRWAPGAVDGVIGHHAAPSTVADDVRRILHAVRDLLAESSAATLGALYEAVSARQLLSYIDELLPAMNDEFHHQRVRLAAIARCFATRAPRREAVKFGIALLGLAGDESDRDTLFKLGASDEFALFAAVAISRLSPTPDLDLWEMAKSLQGWGRIQLVERLRDTEDPQIRSWMLREGFRNDIMNEYLACICARAGRLHEALRVNPQDAKLLDAAADLLLAMLSPGPAEGIRDFEHAAEAVEAYLDSLWGQQDYAPKHLTVIAGIGSYADSIAGSEEQVKGGWTADNRERCLHQCLDLIRSVDWTPGILQDLESPDPEVFHWANAAARIMAIETFDILIDRIRANPLNATFWFYLAEATDENRVDQLVALAESALPLAEIASGPADELGFGPGFEAHRILDPIFQTLDRFPGKGWNLIRSGLHSPVTRNRRCALQSLKNWPRSEWPEQALDILRTAYSVEPYPQHKKDLEEVLD